MPNSRSKYAEEIIKFIKDADRPVTITEIQEAVGMSRQAAYQWRDRNITRLRPAGKGRAGATAYLLDEAADGADGRSGAHAGARAGVAAGVATAADRDGLTLDELRLGATFQVAGLRLDNDRTVVTLTDDAGHVLDVIV